MSHSDATYVALLTPRESQGSDSSMCADLNGVEMHMTGSQCVRDPDVLEDEVVEHSLSTEQLQAQRWRGQYALICSLGLLCTTCASICILWLIVTFHGSMSYLSWMLMSAFAAISLASRKFVVELQLAYTGSCFVVLHIRNDGVRDPRRYLIEAVQVELRQQRPTAESEVIIEHEDSATDTPSWRPVLVAWNQQCSLQVEWKCRVCSIDVETSDGDPIVCGPKQDIMRPQSMVLRIQSSSMWEFFTFLLQVCFSSHCARSLLTRQAEDMRFLHSWLQELFNQYMRTTQGRVEVYDLKQDCKDWSPEWQRVRHENAIHGDTIQRAGYFAQYQVKEWATQMLKYAQFATKRCSRMKTTLYLHGPKGSGKTIFVEWLASELRLPIYFIDLQSSLISDDVLRDALTPRRLKHNLPVIFHFDEFQSVITRWTSDTSVSAQQNGITIQGLQCVLEGISTPNNALFLFTGCVPLPDATCCGPFAHEWIGLLRRFTVQQEIPRVTTDDVKEFITNFFRPYFPPLRLDDYFETLRTEWFLDEQHIPFDMIAKYCERQVREGYVSGLIVEHDTGMKMVHVVDGDGVAAFLGMSFAADSLRAWVRSYAGGKYAQRSLLSIELRSGVRECGVPHELT